MAAPFFRLIHGRFTIVGKEPDGDSVRFIAGDPEHYRALWRAHRIRLAHDGSVQVRLEGVDAPECHYGRQAQPLGREARDAALAWLGFTDVRFAVAPATVVQSAHPEAIAGALLTHGADVNGRPVCYALTDEVLRSSADGDWLRVDEGWLERTLNFRLLHEGLAYPLVYTSTPFEHRRTLRAVAAAARATRRGVWALDSTAEFRLDDQESLGPAGQLILPKLFRRCTDYLQAAAQGYRGNLQDWLVAVSRRRSRNENDRVVLRDSVEVRLSDLIEQRNRWVAFAADPLDLTFMEK